MTPRRPKKTGKLISCGGPKSEQYSRFPFPRSLWVSKNRPHPNIPPPPFSALARAPVGPPPASADVSAFELHLQQLYLYYKTRRRRGQGGWGLVEVVITYCCTLVRLLYTAVVAVVAVGCLSGAVRLSEEGKERYQPRFGPCGLEAVTIKYHRHYRHSK